MAGMRLLTFARIASHASMALPLLLTPPHPRVRAEAPTPLQTGLFSRTVPKAAPRAVFPHYCLPDQGRALMRDRLSIAACRAVTHSGPVHMRVNDPRGFDFGLGETADMLRDSVRGFAADRIAPRAHEIDRSNTL